MSMGQLESSQAPLERDCLRAVNRGCDLSVLDGSLLLKLNLPVKLIKFSDKVTSEKSRLQVIQNLTRALLPLVG